ncbi:hypothetical protein MASR1M32_35530 [Rhodobacter sp.]
MKRLLVLTTALGAFALPAAADDVTVMGWGGAYANSQIEAYFKPFEAATGNKVISIDSDNPATPLKAQVEASNVTMDVAVLEIADAVRLCDEGMIIPIDVASLPAGADGTAAADDFLAGTVTECMIPTDIYSTIIGYDTSKFAEGAGPKTMADFFDTEKFPGKRGVRKSPKATLEMALMADGVPASEVYALLATPEGVDRAFAKLDTIKKDSVFWEAGAQPPQLLADGEVVMTMSYNGRIFNAAHQEGKTFGIMWDGQVYDWEGMVIPKGAPNEAGALEADQVRHLVRGFGQGGRVHLLRPAAQIGCRTGWQYPGGRSADAAEPADRAGQHDQCPGLVAGVLGRPRHRAG